MTNGSSEQQTEATIANVDAQGRVANRADRSADQPAAPLGTASSGSMPLTVAMPPSGSAFAVALPEDRPLIVENADLEEVTRTEAGGDTILTFADGGTIVLTGVTGVTLARGELGGRAAIIVLEDEAAEVEPEAGEKADHGGGADFAALSIDDLGATPGVTGAGAASDAGGLGGGASDARGLSGALSGNAAGDGASNGNGSGSGGASGPNTNTLMPNYAPVANDDVARGDEDHLLRFNLLANDTDPNNNEHLSVVAVDAPGLQGRLSFDAEGNVVFDPRGVFDHLQQGEEAVQTFRYTVQDRHGATDEAVGTLIIEGRNDRPVASDDNIHLDEDTPLTFKSKWLSADDFDVDGDTLRVSSVGKAEHGRVVLNPDGTITFTPDANFNGEASFHYTVSDGHGGFDTGRVAVHVAAVNDRPDPTEDNVRTVEDQAITFPAGWLSGDDFDVEGDTLRVESVHHAENGTVVLHKNGTITFTPDADFNGVASFRYTVTDGNGGHSAERVNVHVAPVNDAPVASDDTVSTDEDTALTFASSQLAADDLDVDGDALTVTEVRNATNGTVTLDADGTILFTPDANFAGIAGFDYTVSDGQGGFDTAHVTVQVRPVNDAPVAASDAFFGMEDTALVLQPEDLLANDADLDGDALTITRVFDAVNGTATLMPDGTIVVTPDANFDGVVRFEYAIADPSGETSEAFGYVVATSVNDAPTRIRLANRTVDENDDGAVIGKLKVIDPDIGDFHDLEVDDPRFEIDERGRLKLKDGESLDFEAEPTVRVHVTATDQDGAAFTRGFTIRVQDVDEAPVGGPDTVLTNRTDGSNIVIAREALLANDADPEGDAFELVSATTDDVGAGVSVNADNVVFAPGAAPFTGGSFTYDLGSHGAADPASDPVGVTISAVDGPLVRGTGADEIILGTGDADELRGAGGDDYLVGFNGDDRIFGGSGDDVLRGGGGADELHGGNGADTLRGGGGDDILEGGNGADLLEGGGGDDRLEGGNGADILDGGAGTNLLTGGNGADTFRFTHANGDARITDFSTGDRLDLADLLTGVGDHTGPGLEGHLQFTLQGADTVLQIDTDGGGDFGAADVTVTFDGIDLIAGAVDQAQTIDQLIAAGQLEAA